MAPLAALRDKRVLVTGHTGFKGSWLALWLAELGARVTGYALEPPSTPSNFAVSGVSEVVDGHHIGDIRDEKHLRKVVDDAAPEVIFHLAAEALVRPSYREPLETFSTNVMGTATLLDVVRTRGVDCVVVVVTSDKCYENVDQVWGYRECDPMGGHDPYSASKGAAELVTASYQRSFFRSEYKPEHGVRLATARAGNVIGGGDWAEDRIITDIVRHLAEGKPVPVRSPRAVRPWQHVLEPLSGYLVLASQLLGSEDPALCGAWNFGPTPGSEVPVGDLVDLFCSAWSGGAWEDVSDPDQPHEAHLLRLNIDKAIWSLGWRPRWTTSEAIERTARWYQAYYADPSRSMRDRCLADIRDFAVGFGRAEAVADGSR